MKPAALSLLAAFSLCACGPSPEQQTAATTAPAVTSPSPGDYDAVGTEPFWTVKIRGNTLTLSRPDAADVVASETEAEAMGDTLVYWGKPFSLTLLRRVCSDGMSDRRYAYEAEVRIEGDVLKGCADTPGANATPRS